MARILVVEDDPLSRKLTSLMLRRAGHDVVLAVDAYDAERELDIATPDLILVDLNLPRKDGCTFTRELRRRTDTANRPIVAVTAFTDAWNERSAREAGCSDYLPKPVKDSALRRCLRHWLPELTSGRN